MEPETNIIFKSKQIKLRDMNRGKKRMTGYISRDMVYHCWRTYPEHVFNMYKAYNLSEAILEDLIQKGVKKIYLDEKRRYCPDCDEIISHKLNRGKDKKEHCPKCGAVVKKVVFRVFIVTPNNFKARSLPYKSHKFESQKCLPMSSWDDVIWMDFRRKVTNSTTKVGSFP